MLLENLRTSIHEQHSHLHIWPRLSAHSEYCVGWLMNMLHKVVPKEKLRKAFTEEKCGTGVMVVVWWYNSIWKRIYEPQSVKNFLSPGQSNMSWSQLTDRQTSDKQTYTNKHFYKSTSTLNSEYAFLKKKKLAKKEENAESPFIQ